MLASTVCVGSWNTLQTRGRSRNSFKHPERAPNSTPKGGVPDLPLTCCDSVGDNVLAYLTMYYKLGLQTLHACQGQVSSAIAMGKRTECPVVS